MKLKLLPKFIISLGIVGLILTVAVSFFSYRASEAYLLDMYAERVMNNCNTITQMIDVDSVKRVISEDGDKSLEYVELYNLFNKLKKDNNITFLSLVIPDEDSVCFYIDAMVEEMGDDPNNQLPYGSDILYTDAANPNDPTDLEKYITIYSRYKENKGLDKPLITDNDYGYNYTGVGVILDESGSAIAQIQYILDMSSVRRYLNSFLLTMLLISFSIIAATMVLYIIFVRRTVTKPVGRLESFTREITKSGCFENQRIEIKTGDEIEFLSASFNYMLIELENYISNLSRVTAEKERIGAELDVAKSIQASMLPCIFPAFPDRTEFDIYASMTPAKEVGGDFYDFFLVDDDHLALVIADVSGKGVPAALFMMIAKTLIKSTSQTLLSPKAVFEKVNNQLCENNDAQMFVTAWLGILEISSGRMVCVNAGHEYPIIKRRDGEFELFKDKHGFVLAGLENSKYREYEVFLNPGDKLFVYTDGVPEATNIGNEFYTIDRTIVALNRSKDNKVSEILNSVKEDIDRFAGSANQFDDITMLSLEYKGKCEQTITLPAKIDSLDKMIEFLEGVLVEKGVERKIISKINISTDEVVSNIISYSGASNISLSVSLDDEKIKLCIKDDGKEYNPLENKDPDVSLSLDERSIGGLGIFMVKKSMDELSYEYKDGLNILSLTKSVR